MGAVYLLERCHGGNMLQQFALSAIETCAVNAVGMFEASANVLIDDYMRHRMPVAL